MTRHWTRTPSLKGVLQFEDWKALEAAENPFKVDDLKDHLLRLQPSTKVERMEPGDSIVFFSKISDADFQVAMLKLLRGS